MQRGYNIYSHTSSIRTSAHKDTADWLIEHRKLTLPLEGVIFFFFKTRKENYVLVLFLSDDELKVLLTIQAR